MCDDAACCGAAPSGWDAQDVGGMNISRRAVLGTLSGAVIGASASSLIGADTADAASSVPAIEVRPGLRVYPRDAWGKDLPPRRALVDEEVKYLLVHHTATSSRPRSVRGTIRSIYGFHTRSKHWSDVCYNFFVGPDGSVWEARAGSMDRAVRAAATGGSQGFGQLVCVIGNYNLNRPSAAAFGSLVKVLAWLADRHGVDTSPGATATFVSRGSNRWPGGMEVTTPTITGHRAMSRTTCPGRYLVARLPDLRVAVQAQRDVWAAPGPV